MNNNILSIILLGEGGGGLFHENFKNLQQPSIIPLNKINYIDYMKSFITVLAEICQE